MSLKWINIRTGEKTVVEQEPHIAALWASSDHSPNITQGQDFGWRLAPEVVVEMKQIKQDLPTLERIAQRFRKALEDLGEIDILTYISNRTALEAAPEPEADDFQDEYDAEIRKLEGRDAPAHDLFTDDDIEQSKPLATMSDEELEAELAKRHAERDEKTATGKSNKAVK